MPGPRIHPASSWRRQQWRPLAAIGRTPRNWLHHSGGGAKNLNTLLGNESYHVGTLGWRALGYSWAVNVGRVRNGFADVYEGRGWGKAGGHTAGDNHASHGILLVGDWTTATATEVDAAAKSVAWLIDDGARRGFTARVLSGGHRDAPGASTACPGTAGMQVLARARQLLATIEDEMTPTEKKMLAEVYRQLCEGPDAPDASNRRTVRTRVWQTNAALGRMEPQLDTVHHEVTEGNDDGTPEARSSRTLRDRVYQSNHALGRVARKLGV